LLQGAFSSTSLSDTIENGENEDREGASVSAKATDTPPLGRDTCKEVPSGVQQPFPALAMCSHPKETCEAVEGTMVRPDRATKVVSTATAVNSSLSKRSNQCWPETESNGMMNRRECHAQKLDKFRQQPKEEKKKKERMPSD